MRFRTLPSAFLAAAVLVLTACGSSAPTAEQCQNAAFFEENTEGCIEAAKAVAGEDFPAGESTDESGGETGSEESGEAAEAVLEGPASEPGTLLEGLTVQIVAVEATPAEAWVAEDIPGHDTIVQLTVRLTAEEETVPVNVDPMGGIGTAGGRLVYSPNFIEANGWAVENGISASQVTPGVPLDVVEEFSLPASGLGDLSYAFSSEQGTASEFMFTDVEALLP